MFFHSILIGRKRQIRLHRSIRKRMFCGRSMKQFWSFHWHLRTMSGHVAAYFNVKSFPFARLWKKALVFSDFAKPSQLYGFSLKFWSWQRVRKRIKNKFSEEEESLVFVFAAFAFFDSKTFFLNGQIKQGQKTKTSWSQL